MRYVRGFCFLAWALLACGVQADTIPTLAATSGNAYWESFFIGGTVSGPDFVLYSPATMPLPLSPCSPQLPPGDCVAPGPTLFLYWENRGTQKGQLALGGTTYDMYYEGNAQIQYLTPTITYPARGPGFSSVDIPVILSGSERACLKPEFSSPANPCLGLDSFGRPLPGYPNYLANISINVPGTLTLLGNGNPLIDQLSGAFFVSSPEPGSVALAFAGFLLLLMRWRVRRKRSLLQRLV